jgi:hypothetical protein
MRSPSANCLFRSLFFWTCVCLLPITLCAQNSTRPATLNGMLSPANPQLGTSHSVTLSWTASVPASASSADRITGYRIYRNTSLPVLTTESNRVSCSFISVTSCEDSNVSAGVTYYYVATALVGSSTATKESTPSQPPLKVTIPSP